MNNNTCSFCYPLMSATKQPRIFTSPGRQARSRRRCGCAISGRLFLNVYNDLHFPRLNVLKAGVTAVLNWVSITSIPGSIRAAEEEQTVTCRHQKCRFSDGVDGRQ